MDYPNFIASNQKEESMSIQRVKLFVKVIITDDAKSRQ